jgi:hypothetical protein
MQNRTHRGESKEQRLRRFQAGAPIESIETLLNSIDNYFNNEISLTPAAYQTSLLFLGIHAVAMTIAEAFWNSSGAAGYKKFLETFVDGVKDKRFSDIADEIHDWRNVLAHQWIGSVGHEIEYDYDMQLGWERRGDVLAINPKIYCEQYLSAFSAGGKIWGYDKILTPEELGQASDRIVKKYVSR